MGCDAYLTGPPDHPIKYECYGCGREVTKENFSEHDDCAWFNGMLKINTVEPDQYEPR